MTHINNVEFYRYDPDGRGRLDQLRNDDNTVNTYAYQPQGRDWLRSAGPNSYTQDGVGNVRTRTVGGVTQQFDYTAFDLPSHISLGSTATDFAYTAGNARAVKKSPTATTFYAGDHHQEIQDQGGARHARSMIYVGSRAVAEVTSGAGGSAATRYLYDDALGSVQTTATSAGTVDSVRDYSPFGEIRNSSSVFDNVPYGFTGHEEDTDLGLTNMKGRLYDPVSGQFLEADPAVQDPAGQGLNRYAYVNNSPLNFVDPSGKSLIGDLGREIEQKTIGALGRALGRVDWKEVGRDALGLAGRAAESIVLSRAGSYLAENFGSGLLMDANSRAVQGGLNGAITGWRGTYDFYKHGSGYPAFILDSTWGIYGTTLGNYVNIINTAGTPFGTKYSDALSHRQNQQVFINGFFLMPGKATTFGNVISNFGNHTGGLLGHESEHIWQNRLFGPIYTVSYFDWAVFFTAFFTVFDFPTHLDRLPDDINDAAYLSNPWESHAYCENNPGGLKSNNKGSAMTLFCSP